MHPTTEFAAPGPASGVGCASASTSTAEARFAAAIALYDERRWTPAYAAFAALADLGHVPACRLALLMLRCGAPWYQTSFSATPVQVACWARRVLHAPRAGGSGTVSGGP